jgi:tetraacyldisaccharide-1-P 4'-kinase
MKYSKKLFERIKGELGEDEESQKFLENVKYLDRDLEDLRLLFTEGVTEQNKPSSITQLLSDAKEVLQTNNIKDFKLIGGIALKAYGSNRTTTDVDFIITKKDVIKLKAAFKEKKYKDFETKDMIFFVQDLKYPDYRIDFIFADGKSFYEQVLSNTEDKKLIGLKVAGVKDLIRLKLYALSNLHRLKSDAQDLDLLIEYGLENKITDIDYLKVMFNVAKKIGATKRPDILIMFKKYLSKK